MQRALGKFRLSLPRPKYLVIKEHKFKTKYSNNNTNVNLLDESYLYFFKNNLNRVMKHFFAISFILRFLRSLPAFSAPLKVAMTTWLVLFHPPYSHDGQACETSEGNLDISRPRNVDVTFNR